MERENDYFYKLDDSKTLTFTDEGLKYYRALFAMAGINIHWITTESEFNNAVKRSKPYLENHLYGRHLKNKSLESQALIAILNGNQDKVDEYFEKLKRKKKLGLNVLKGH